MYVLAKFKIYCIHRLYIIIDIREETSEQRDRIVLKLIRKDI